MLIGGFLIAIGLVVTYRKAITESREQMPDTDCPHSSRVTPVFDNLQEISNQALSIAHEG